MFATSVSPTTRTLWPKHSGPVCILFPLPRMLFLYLHHNGELNVAQVDLSMYIWFRGLVRYHNQFPLHQLLPPTYLTSIGHLRLKMINEGVERWTHVASREKKGWPEGVMDSGRLKDDNDGEIKG
ncbi:MAG: hypothetical protein Q9211_003812 [Gyalolechia sp. 1 TL-2023]